MHQLWQAIILKPFKLEECILHFWKPPIFIDLVPTDQGHSCILNTVAQESLTDDVRVRPAFSAVKFWAPNFFLETNSDYVKNLGSGEKTYFLAPRGTQGGYLGPRPNLHQNIRKIAVSTTFWKGKNHSLSTSSRTLIQAPMIPKNQIGPFFDPFLA